MHYLAAMAKINMIPPEDILTKDEISWLMKKSNWRGAWEILKIWAWIIAAMALVAWKPNFFTILIAVFVLGGQQLGCSVIMHDAGHYSLFKSQWMNRVFGNLFGAWPILHNVQQYRPYHAKHHRHTGTEDDPDLKLAMNFPVRVASFVRKMIRDLSGINGIKAFLGVIAMHIGKIKYNLGGQAIQLQQTLNSKEKLQLAWINLRGPIFFHLGFFAILYLIGHPWLYAFWWFAHLTTNNFSIRIRSMAEHSMTPDLADPYRNVRTTYANFIERILFAPLYVNYHVEHHLLMAAPAYKYPKLHQMLLEKGFYNKGILSKGYWKLVKKAVRKG